MAETVTKTFTPLSQLEGVVARSCSALMPNRCQCWRAGDVQVIRQKIEPATAETPETITEQVYQLCYRHAQLEKYQDDLNEAHAKEATEQVAKSQVEALNKAVTPAPKKAI